jgi:hypothetical protein
MIKQQIFLSYSHDPPENATFARELAGHLRSVGFEVWLDEEKLTAGADFELQIRAAINASMHALFVVTRRWLERDWTRTELKLFSERPRETHRRVAVRREEIDILRFQPELQHLQVVSWLPDEREPDARFWEVYCGLSNLPPGPRDRWAEQGRAQLAKGERRVPMSAGGELRPRSPLEPDPSWLPCASRPALALPARERTYLLTDDGECCLVDDATLEGTRLPALEGWSSAVVDSEDVLIVGLYGEMTATLKDDDWVYRSSDSAVLSMAATPDGIVIGGADGSVVVRNHRGDALGAVSIGEPVVELCACGQGAVALGGRGALVRLDWPDDGGLTSEPISAPKNLGPMVGLFPVAHPGRFGAYSPDRLATFDAATGRASVCDRAFPDGIGQVAALARGGKRLNYAVLTDAGAVWQVEVDFKEARAVTLPGEPQEVVGICPAGAGGLLAWTSSGNLFAVSRDRAVRKHPITDVSLAFSSTEASDRLWAVRWVRERGLLMVPVRSDQER